MIIDFAAILAELDLMWDGRKALTGAECDAFIDAHEILLNGGYQLNAAYPTQIIDVGPNEAAIVLSVCGGI
jgi:hypothetical protein